MANISKINVNGTEYNIDSVTVNGHTVNSNVPSNYSFEDNNKAFYATCDSTEETYNKVATIQNSSSFSLTVGVTVFVKFAYSNHYNPPSYTPTLTLNVNSTGQKPIQYVSGSDVGNDTRNGWEAGSVVPLTYDGTAWVINGFKKYYIPGSGLSEQNVSGVNTYTMLKHSNNITAQNTQAVYPIKIDSNGHIKAYGEAVTIPDNNRRGFYATCTTAADAQNKVATLADNEGWELKAGTIVGVKYTNTNTYSSTAEAPLTLNINNTGDKQIYASNVLSPTGTQSTYYGYAGQIMYYMYDGTYWAFLGHSADNNSDTKVRQTLKTDNVNRPLLMAYSNNTVTTGNVDNVAYRNNNIYANASTGNIQAVKLNGVTIGNSPKFTDTTYESKTAASGGTAVSLVTTGEKYTWNNKGDVTHDTNTEAGSAVTLNADQLQGYSLNQLLKLIYPIGAIYMTTHNTSPADFITGTTWTLRSSVALASEHVFGNGISIGLNDGTQNGAMSSGSSGSAIGSRKAGFGLAVGATASDTTGLSTSKMLGVPTKAQAGNTPEYTGLIADTITVYTWERTA